MIPVGKVLYGGRGLVSQKPVYLGKRILPVRYNQCNTTAVTRTLPMLGRKQAWSPNNLAALETRFSQHPREEPWEKSPPDTERQNHATLRPKGIISGSAECSGDRQSRLRVRNLATTRSDYLNSTNGRWSVQNQTDPC
jgi:hypothetical protein